MKTAPALPLFGAALLAASAVWGHGASRGLHVHLDPDPAPAGGSVRVEIVAAEPLTRVRVALADGAPLELTPDPAVRRTFVTLEVPEDARGVLSCQAEATTVSGETVRASAVLRVSPDGGPCGPLALADPLGIRELIARALRTLAGAGHRPEDYDLGLRSPSHFEDRLPATDRRSRHAVVFVPRGPAGYAVQVDAREPCVLAWAQGVAEPTAWQRRVLERAQRLAFAAGEPQPAGARVEVFETRDRIRVRWLDRDGVSERTVTLERQDAGGGTP